MLSRITEQATIANIYSPGDRPVPYPDIFRVKFCAVRVSLGCEAISIPRAGDREAIVVRGAGECGCYSYKLQYICNHRMHGEE